MTWGRFDEEVWDEGAPLQEGEEWEHQEMETGTQGWVWEALLLAGSEIV